MIEPFPTAPIIGHSRPGGQDPETERQVAPQPPRLLHGDRYSHDPLIDLRTAAPTAHPAFLAATAAASSRLEEFGGHGGYHPAGLLELRAALAAQYCRSGVPTDPDQILITSGAQHGLNLLFHHLLQPGDRVAVEDPTYPNALALLRRLGVRLVTAPMTSTGVDVAALEAVFRQSAPRLAYLMPDHHNPTGATLDHESRVRIVQLAERCGVLLVSDDTLRDVTIDADPPAPLGGCDTFSGATVVRVGSASKLLWGGLRVGWIRGPAELVVQLARARAVVDLSSPVLEQLLTLELLSRTRDANDRRELLRSRRDLLIAALAQRTPAWRANRPSGGLALWVDVGRHRERSVVSLAAANGVLVAGGSAFSVEGISNRHIRIAFTQPPSVLMQAVEVLEQVHHAMAADRSPQCRVSSI